MSNSSNAASSPPASSIYHEEYATPWRPLLAIVFPILPIFWKYRVDITKTTLTMGYTYAYSQIDRNDIISAAPIEHVNGLTQWGGWGIRFNRQWDMGYIVKNGPAVRIEVRKNKEGDDNVTKIYVFNCDDAERVSRILS